MSQNNNQNLDAGAIPVRPVPSSSVNIKTATSTVVKAASGALSRVTVNTGGAGSTAALYDGLDNTGVLLGTVSTAAQVSLGYDVAVAVGLCVVTAGGTPADITVAYR